MREDIYCAGITGYPHVSANTIEVLEENMGVKFL